VAAELDLDLQAWPSHRPDDPARPDAAQKVKERFIAQLGLVPYVGGIVRDSTNTL
jgi:hypothetical protein